MRDEKEVILKVEHLCCYFGKKKAVDDVSFEVYRGEVFGLVGESGCGKTTTGRCIIQLYPPTAGNIYFHGRRIAAGTVDLRRQIKLHGRSIRRLKAQGSGQAQQRMHFSRDEIADLRRQLADARRDNRASGVEPKIQMIFQDPMASLDPRMTVGEIIAEGLIIGGMRDKKQIRQRVEELLQMVGLRAEYASRFPHEFSGGQRQRIGIARAIIMKPELLIADEPISALDVSIQAQIINLLNDLRKKMDLTVLFIAHDLSVVKYFSDRIGVMYLGKLVELAPADELFEHPLHPYTKSLLSAIPLPDPRRERSRVRILYDPLRDQDNGGQPPRLRQISPGHWVSCNDGEQEKYRKELGLL